MANIIRSATPDLEDKFYLMQENARYDIVSSMEACAPDFAEVKKTYRGKKTLPKVPKVFLSNECIFNCAYCGCRSGNDCKQVYQTTPRELAELSLMTAAQRGSGIFLSSAIYKTPDYTMELIIETLRLIREDYGYKGYLHAKVMPGSDMELIRRAGLYADRLSVNIEVAKSEGYSKIAVNKNKNNILTPMRHISDLIKEAKEENKIRKPRFATSQTTQLMVGSTEEDDHTVLNLAGALYKKYSLSRVYYTAFSLKNQAAGYGELPTIETPKWRVGRMYQADRLIKEYGFTAADIVPETAPNLRPDLDPKTAWALRNLHLFPIEVNTADYNTLLKIPGIGTTYAARIIQARRYCTITHAVLKKLGVSMKKSRHFLTCNGKFSGAPGENADLLTGLLSDFPPSYYGEQLTFEAVMATHAPIHRAVSG